MSNNIRAVLRWADVQTARQKYLSNKPNRSARSPLGMTGVRATLPMGGRKTTPGGSRWLRLRWHKIPFKSNTNKGCIRKVVDISMCSGNCRFDSYRLQLVTTRMLQGLGWFRMYSTLVHLVDLELRAQPCIRSCKKKFGWLVWCCGCFFCCGGNCCCCCFRSLFCCRECLIFFFFGAGPPCSFECASP